RRKRMVYNIEGPEQSRLAEEEEVEIGARDADFGSELIHGEIGQGLRAQQAERDLEHTLTSAWFGLQLKCLEESGPGGKCPVERRSRNAGSLGDFGHRRLPPACEH